MPLPNTESPFAPSAEQQLLPDQVDRFARTELHPLAARMDDEEWWPADAFRRTGALGCFGATIPEAFGGSGMGLIAAGLILQGMARWNHALALSVAAHDNLCANNIRRNGNDDQRRRYLPDLCAGRTVGALGLTEPGAGSDALGSMRTTARRDGDHDVPNGRTRCITNGPVADVLLVHAKTDRAAGPHGISAFIVEKGMPGSGVAQKLEKLGFRGSLMAELVFEECRGPAATRVGEENRGVPVVMSGLDLERAIITPICLGVAERAGGCRRTMPGRAGSSASRSAASRWCRPCWPTSAPLSRRSAPSRCAFLPRRRTSSPAAAGAGTSTP